MKKTLLKTLPVMAGYLVLGIGFGMILRQKGYGVPWAFAMSALIYAGSMQYAAVPLLVSAAPLPVVFFTTLAVNARHVFYGISMIDRYRDMPKKPFLIFGLTDETYSLVSTGTHDASFCVWVTLLDYCYWVAGSVLGSVVGGVLPFDLTGVDFALTALFLTVFLEMWLSGRDRFAGGCGLIVTFVSLLTFGKDAFLLPAMVCITIALIVRGRREAGHDA